MGFRRISGLAIAIVGALLSIVGYISFENSEGLEGLNYAPLIYGGLLIFIVGIIKGLIEFHKSALITKIILSIIIFGVVVMLIMSYVITTRDSNRAKYCDTKYPYKNIGGYRRELSKQEREIYSKQFELNSQCRKNQIN